MEQEQKTGNQNKKKYWFTMEPYVHISLKKNSLLLYNTLSGKALEYNFPGVGQSKIPALFRKLQARENLQVTALTERDLQHPEIYRLVNETRQYYMSEFIDVGISNGKPVQMKPEVTIIKDIDKLEHAFNRSGGEDTMTYLTEISLYINNACSHNCSICRTGFKQFPCCRCTSPKNKNATLEPGKIQNLFNALTMASLRNINILGGNIFAYESFKELAAMLNYLRVKKTIYNHYQNFPAGNEHLKYLNPRSSILKILVTFPLNMGSLKLVLETITKTALQYEFIFIIQDGWEYEQAEEVIKSLQIHSSSYQPFFNGKNREFFQENVFMGKDEILDSRPSMRDIYINTAVNQLDFGRITILSNGNIHANVNKPRLGVLGKGSLNEMLYKELTHGKSWRKVRRRVKPCNQCTYQSLCPPLNNYNYVLGKNNLCHISMLPMPRPTGR